MSNLYDIPLGYETRMKILKTIDSLLQNQTLESLTVTMICSEAHIARQSFYRYFADKYEAINWYHMLLTQRSIHLIGHSLTWNEGVRKILEYVLEEKTLYRKALTSVDDYNSLMNYSARLNASEWKQTITETNKIPLTKELDFMVDLWGHTGAWAIRDWVLNDFQFTPQEAADLLDQFRPKKLQMAMDEPVLRRRSSSTPT